MVMDFKLYDINLHMYNHYRRINSAKTVLNSNNLRSSSTRTSSPSRNISWSSRNSSHGSRYSTPTLLWPDGRTLRRTNSQHKLKPKKHDCLTREEKLPPTKSNYFPPRPQTRRNPKVVPVTQAKFESSFAGGKQKSPSGKKPVPTPRNSNKKKSVIPEYEYLQFSLRITEDIIRNDLYTDAEMKRVFNSHIAANQGRLDMKKMQQHIDLLCEELNLKSKNCECPECPESPKLSGRKDMESEPNEAESPDIAGPSATNVYDKDSIIQKIISGQEVITSEEIKHLSDEEIQEVIAGILNDEHVQVTSQTSIVSTTTLTSQHESVSSREDVASKTSLQNVENASQTDDLYVNNYGAEHSTQTSPSLGQMKDNNQAESESSKVISNTEVQSGQNSTVNSNIELPTKDGDNNEEIKEESQTNVNDNNDSQTNLTANTESQTNITENKDSQTDLTSENSHHSEATNEKPQDEKQTQFPSNLEMLQTIAEDEQSMDLVEIPTRDDGENSEVSYDMGSEVRSNRDAESNCWDQSHHSSRISLDHYVTTYMAYNNDLLNRLKQYEQVPTPPGKPCCSCKDEYPTLYYPSVSTQTSSLGLSYDEELSEGEIKSSRRKSKSLA